MAWVEHTGREIWRVRYRQEGTVETVSGFSSQQAAQASADRLSAKSRGAAGADGVPAVSVGEWVDRWLPSLDVEIRTEENYRACLDNHVLPRWCDTQLVDISPLAVTTWAMHLRSCYADATVATIMCVFSTLLDDAVDEGLVRLNPVRRRRRGRRRDHQPLPPERVWATPEQVLAVAAQATALAGRCTGCWWSPRRGPAPAGAN